MLRFQCLESERRQVFIKDGKGHGMPIVKHLDYVLFSIVVSLSFRKKARIMTPGHWVTASAPPSNAAHPLAQDTCHGEVNFDMQPQLIPESNYLMRMADGTIKQVNPFTGTEVWTVPGRGNRPLGVGPLAPAPLDPDQHDAHCAFCARRYLETPPEKARLIRTGHGFATLRHLHAEALFDTVAEFRRVPDLFEIVSLDYWRKNFGYRIPDAIAAHQRDYLASEAGRRHVLQVVEQRLKASGLEEAARSRLSQEEKLQMASAFFGGGHEVIVARRHFVDGATHNRQLASSGTLTPEEHY